MLKKTTESKLLAGYIYGDNVTKEYVYLLAAKSTQKNPCSSTKTMEEETT